MERVIGMQNHALKYGWQIMRGIRRAGWPICIAFVVFFLALFLAVVAFKLHTKALQPLAVPVADQAKNVEITTPGVTEDRLAVFEKQLPDYQAVTDKVKNLLVLAEKMQVELSTGEYHAQKDVGSPYLRYLITLPIKGEYGSIQAFLLKALEQNRALAIDSISFKRDGIDSPEVEARVQLVLFAHAKPGSSDEEPESP